MMPSCRPVSQRQTGCLFVSPCAGFPYVKCPKRLRESTSGTEIALSSRFVLGAGVDYFVPHDAESSEPSARQANERRSVRALVLLSRGVSRGEQRRAGRSSSAKPQLEGPTRKRA